MTRKDYVKFAAMLKAKASLYSYEDNRRVDDYGQAAFATIRDIASDMGHIFAADNPNFDRARFLAACGVNS